MLVWKNILRSAHGLGASQIHRHGSLVDRPTSLSHHQLVRLFIDGLELRLPFLQVISPEVSLLSASVAELDRQLKEELIPVSPFKLFIVLKF